MTAEGYVGSTLGKLGLALGKGCLVSAMGSVFGMGVMAFVVGALLVAQVASLEPDSTESSRRTETKN